MAAPGNGSFAISLIDWNVRCDDSVFRCFVSDIQTFKLYDKNESFSELAVVALKKIKYCAVTIIVLYVLEMPFLYILNKVDDAPGILIGIVAIFASIVIAVFPSVLQKLLKSAIDIKSEVDLTV